MELNNHYGGFIPECFYASKYKFIIQKIFLKLRLGNSKLDIKGVLQ